MIGRGPAARATAPWPGAQELVDQLEALVAPSVPAGDWWNWQALPLADFYPGMRAVRDTLGPGKHRFLDVGSGIGSKLYLAMMLGFQPEGVEHASEYVKVSRRLCPDAPVHHVDARRFTGYGRFDVVYCNRPARDYELQVELNGVILERMRAGALFFCPSEPYPDGEPVAGYVWSVTRG